jgi:hypothetical protein
MVVEEIGDFLVSCDTWNIKKIGPDEKPNCDFVFVVDEMTCTEQLFCNSQKSLMEKSGRCIRLQRPQGLYL